MNSEELERSLRSEFENYLKNFRAEIRQEADELQKRLGEAFKAYAARFDSSPELDEAFTSTVTEHLRLARDEGAKLTATALAEAEEMDGGTAAAADYNSIRDAVADITTQTSQSSILKSLVNRAADFAPRGAFFIVKNEQLVGWKVTGPDSGSFESVVSEIHFPVAADTVLGRAVSSMLTVDSSYGAHAEDQGFLGPLQFGQPDHMYAIPLVARGRGVAVLYADHGAGDGKVNVEALETLVRVAALTVELLAATQPAHSEAREETSADLQYSQSEAATTFDEQPQQRPVEQREEVAPEFASSDGYTGENGFGSPVSPSEEPVHEVEYAFEPVQEVENAFEPVQEEQTAFETVPEQTIFEPVQEQPTNGDMIFGSDGSTEPAVEQVPSPFETAVRPEPAGVGVVGAFAPEGGVDISASQTGPTRLRDRNVDLPIDVDEGERRQHNDARRFARLLVSEIKLYNEKKVQEGRQANDLYERLREAIDRSREMYDKRVQPPVAAKFDYFHYELVNALADGNAAHLGTSYPGSAA